VRLLPCASPPTQTFNLLAFLTHPSPLIGWLTEGSLYNIHTFSVHYSLNRYVSTISGIANAMGWFIWCFYYRKSQPYVWRCALFVLLVGVCMIFEVLDFPPLLWIMDAHALWHLATAGLPFLFYRYVGILMTPSCLSIAGVVTHHK
jgi:hypothetical protein